MLSLDSLVDPRCFYRRWIPHCGAIHPRAIVPTCSRSAVCCGQKTIVIAAPFFFLALPRVPSEPSVICSFFLEPPHARSSSPPSAAVRHHESSPLSWSQDAPQHGVMLAKRDAAPENSCAPCSSLPSCSRAIQCAAGVLAGVKTPPCRLAGGPEPW